MLFRLIKGTKNENGTHDVFHARQSKYRALDQ